MLDRAGLGALAMMVHPPPATAPVTTEYLMASEKLGTRVLRKVIFEGYRRGGFGSLVVGRRGMERRYFTGSVSRYLVNQFSGGALLVAP